MEVGPGIFGHRSKKSSQVEHVPPRVHGRSEWFPRFLGLHRSGLELHRGAGSAGTARTVRLTPKPRGQLKPFRPKGGWRAYDKPFRLEPAVDPADAIAPWPRVLLVEDDQANRRRIRAILSEEGISVIGEASDGATGVRLARELGPDVILMDLRMPFMGGLEATRVIKEKLPNTQVIILTSYDGPLPSRSAEQAGAYAYLVKGCSAKLLREMIYQAWKYRVGLQRADEEQTADGLTSMLFGEDQSQASFDAAADPPGPLDPFASGNPLEPAEPMPDQIPEDFVERFGREARQTVRYRTSRRY